MLGSDLDDEARSGSEPEIDRSARRVDNRRVSAGSPMRTIVTSDRKVVVLDDTGTWSYAPTSGSVFQRWTSLAIPRDLVELFRGIFERLGVRIIDTGEAWTCIHRGDRIEFVAGIDEAAVELTVPIYEYQAERLARHIQSGALDEMEWFRVARELMINAPAAGHLLVHNALSSSPMLRRVIRAKNLVHVFLISPDTKQEPDATFTFIYVNNGSLLVPGLHGAPERVFRLTVRDALELQRKMAAGRKTSSWAARVRLAYWYVRWRSRVQAPA